VSIALLKKLARVIQEDDAIINKSDAITRLERHVFLGTRLFGLTDSVWPFRSGRFGLGRFGLGHFGLADSVWAVSAWAISVSAVSVWAASVWRHFGLGRFCLGTFRSDYEILQKFYMFTF